MRDLAMRVAVLAVAASALFAAPATAQQPQPKRPPRGGTTIEIRGQVPTPQVVTVRPREVPQYSRQVLTPTYFDRNLWSTVTPGFSVVPSRQVHGGMPIDTTPAAIANGGLPPTNAPGTAGLAAPAPATSGGTDSAHAAPAGASAAEIEAMRHELDVRRARLDSLQRALRENEDKQKALANTPAPGLGPPRMSAADSAARAQEIEAIRRELQYRKARLDSLQQEIRNLGRPKKAPAPSDTTRPPRTTPRARRR